MDLLFGAVFVSLLSSALSDVCPKIFLRYSTEHSYCKSKNATCQIFYEGVTTKYVAEILHLHNKYRNFVATGKERRAGGLPPAADMIQMVWDRELAAVAQKRAQQCVYAHDCRNCRRVENFDVGQNIAYREQLCTGSMICLQNPIPDWNNVFTTFYNEVADFNKKYVFSMGFIPGVDYSHFTQMTWSRTWRVGCGYVVFTKGNGYRQLYICNYGPSGNVVNAPLYTAGTPCSKCPINSCCGSSCVSADRYPALCKMLNTSVAPVYRPKQDYIFYCDFRSFNGDCDVRVFGAGKWTYMFTLSDSFAEIVLNASLSSSLKFSNPIKPDRPYCVRFQYRCGPTVQGSKSTSRIVAYFQLSGMSPMAMKLPKSPSAQDYFQYSIHFSTTFENTVSLEFSVPGGAVQQFLNLRHLSATRGKC